MYHVLLKVKNGGTTRIFSTHDRQQAASFCKNKNEFYQKVNSPNRCLFEETNEENLIEEYDK